MVKTASIFEFMHTEILHRIDLCDRYIDKEGQECCDTACQWVLIKIESDCYPYIRCEQHSLDSDYSLSIVTRDEFLTYLIMDE